MNNIFLYTIRTKWKKKKNIDKNKNRKKHVSSYILFFLKFLFFYKKFKFKLSLFTV